MKYGTVYIVHGENIWLLKISCLKTTKHVHTKGTDYLEFALSTDPILNHTLNKELVAHLLLVLVRICAALEFS